MEFKANLFLLSSDELIDYYGELLLEASSWGYANELVVKKLSEARYEILKRIDERR